MPDPASWSSRPCIFCQLRTTRSLPLSVATDHLVATIKPTYAQFCLARCMIRISLKQCWSRLPATKARLFGQGWRCLQFEPCLASLGSGPPCAEPISPTLVLALRSSLSLVRSFTAYNYLFIIITLRSCSPHIFLLPPTPSRFSAPSRFSQATPPLLLVCLPPISCTGMRGFQYHALRRTSGRQRKRNGLARGHAGGGRPGRGAGAELGGAAGSHRRHPLLPHPFRRRRPPGVCARPLRLPAFQGRLPFFNVAGHDKLCAFLRQAEHGGESEARSGAGTQGGQGTEGPGPEVSTRELLKELQGLPNPATGRQVMSACAAALVCRRL